MDDTHTQKKTMGSIVVRINFVRLTSNKNIKQHITNVARLHVAAERIAQVSHLIKHFEEIKWFKRRFSRIILPSSFCRQWFRMRWYNRSEIFNLFCVCVCVCTEQVCSPVVIPPSNTIHKMCPLSRCDKMNARSISNGDDEKEIDCSTSSIDVWV